MSAQGFAMKIRVFRYRGAPTLVKALSDANDDLVITRALRPGSGYEIIHKRSGVSVMHAISLKAAHMRLAECLALPVEWWRSVPELSRLYPALPDQLRQIDPSIGAYDADTIDRLTSRGQA